MLTAEHFASALKLIRSVPPPPAECVIVSKEFAEELERRIEEEASPVEATLPAFELPAGLLTAPWGHQDEGYQRGRQILSQEVAFILAAEMGVGKTFIATLLALGLNARSVLIVCPLRVISSWKTQLAQYLPSGSYCLAALDDRLGGKKKKTSVADRLAEAVRLSRLAEATGARFFLAINYDSFYRDGINDFLIKRKWGVVIYDESHKIKAAGSKSSMFAKRLRGSAEKVILASGTFLAHSPLDAYGQMRAADPKVLGTSAAAFRSQYAKLGGPNKQWVVGYQNTEELENKLAPFTWRKTKAEALPYLPEETEAEFATELVPAARKVYDEFEADLITAIEGETLSATNALTKILRLQQICGGGVPTDDGRYHIVDTSKRALLVDTLEDLGPVPSVIFCRFRSDIDAAHEACKLAGRTSKELSGQRNDLEEWQAGEGDDLVVQVQSGSVGISLVRASTAIYYSLSCSLVEYDQSRSRLHRPGQKNTVTYIYLTIQDSIDQKILKALRARKDVVTEIMNEIQRKSNESIGN